MGIGKSMAQKSVQVSLREAIATGVARVETNDPMKPGDLIRGSRLHEVCAKREVLMAKHSIATVRAIDSDLMLTFALGTGMHYALQNEILAPTGILVGQWQCLGCATVVGKSNSTQAAEIIAARVKRPEHCESCNGNKFLFQEYSFEDHELGLSGHPDGLLDLPEISTEPILFEAKSMAESQTWKIKTAPIVDHVVQVHGYMLLSGLSTAIILYWIKGVHGIKGLREFIVQRDEMLILRLRETLAQVRVGLQTLDASEIPRVCSNSQCSRAEACPVKNPCFSDFVPEVDGGVGIF